MALVTRESPRPGALRAAVALSLLLFVLRLHLARTVGFGDAEALYVSYALHPAPAYLDHPGLVGVIARLLGGGFAPSPVTVHQFTAIAATALPWLAFVAARMAGASRAGAFRTWFAIALWPETSIGLFGLTPDLPLAFAWLSALGLVALALRQPPASLAALAAFLGAGLCAGLAIQSKASGVLLLASLAAAFASRGARPSLRTAAPYFGLALAAVLAAPLVKWEANAGFPLLEHRLVATQKAAGFSLRNLGALLGGQLLYVTPPLLVGAYHAVRGTWARRSDPVDALLLSATVIPGLPLAVLCLWSRVAEPHWLAPAYLAVALAASRDAARPRLDRVCLATGVVVALLGWAVVATPAYPKLAGTRYVARYDLTNDLRAWRIGLPMVEEELEDAGAPDGVAVVGPHWVICAQLHAGLGAGIPVGCRTPAGDDFQRWYPESTWKDPATLLLVTDDRFPVDASGLFPDRELTRVRSSRVYFGGVVVRTLRVSRLEARPAGTATPLR